MLSVLPNNRERFAPISLTREQPVAQSVIDRVLAVIVLFQPSDDLLFRWLCRQTVYDGRVDCDSVADESNRIFATQRSHHFANRQIELSRELEIAFVMSGHA